MATIDTSLGSITGTEHGNIKIFRGIRFAEPPVGELRFKPGDDRCVLGHP